MGPGQLECFPWSTQCRMTSLLFSHSGLKALATNKQTTEPFPWLQKVGKQLSLLESSEVPGDCGL